MSLRVVRDEDVAVVARADAHDPGDRAGRDDGGRPTFEALYAEHHDLVYKIGLRYGAGQAQWAEDLTHDVFVRVFDKPEVLDDVTNVAAWLYRTATNACLNRLSRERFLQSAPIRWLLANKVPTPRDPERIGIASQRLAQLMTEVGRMPPRQRACFFMYYVDDKTQAEIGEVLGVSTSYVCKLLTRVKRRLEHFEGERAT